MHKHVDGEFPLAAAHPDAQHDEEDQASFVGRTVAEVERDLILDTLRHCHGNRTRSAAVLGISVRTLRNKLSEYAQAGMSIPPPGGVEAGGEA
jgi:DNA-binding NtrC family response regulator